MQITTIGLDLAKNVFQVHGVNAEREGGRSKKQLRRGQVIDILRQAAAVPGWAWKRARRRITGRASSGSLVTTFG